MPRPLNSPDRLFDRTWRVGHPFRPRLSAGRRWGMVTVFLLLGSIIGAYIYVTDPHRVKAMAQNYLSGLLGGRVEVGKATLSIFQGLRLDKVHVYAAGSGKEDDEHALFSADSFLIEYNPATLLSGKLAATRIKVIDPRVHLTEDVATGRWSFQRLNPHEPKTSAPAIGARPPVLPEILLRNATVEYSEISRGVEGPTNSITLEGQFIPGAEPDTYHFLLQSRGEFDGVGPSVEGTLAMASQQVRFKLSNFVVGPDMKAMLPAEVRKWVEDNQLAGALDAEVEYQFKNRDQPYRVRLDLGGVTATVPPEEWMGENEIRRLDLARRSLAMLKLAGLNTPASGLTDDRFVDHLDSMLSPTPLKLDGVAGEFIFTPHRIEIVSGRGRVESNGFRVEGSIDGYHSSAAIHLHISSPTTENLYVPPSPRYVSSMPGPVRDIYNRFKPQGICSFWADIDRSTEGGAPQVKGELHILDGQFSYEKFAYPVQHVTGTIAIGPDENGEPGMRIVNLRGHGVDGGPNAKADFDINGWMAPLGPEVQIQMDISGKNVVNEPLLTAALPGGAIDAMHLFDAPGRGDLPTYRGDFSVQVRRERGRKSHWSIGTDIHIDDAAGSLAAFPYPLNHVTGDVHIQGDKLDVRNVQMRRGDASVGLDGIVTWGNTAGNTAGDTAGNTAGNAAVNAAGNDRGSHSGAGFGAENGDAMYPASTVRPNLHIVARNVPIDRALLDALPPDRRQWLRNIGIGGTIDLDGTIAAPQVGTLADGQPAPLDLNLGIDWRDGTLAPRGTPFATGMTGKLRLRPQQLLLTEIKGRRGDAVLSGDGSIKWPHNVPEIVFSANATDLRLDHDLYALLPEAARHGWDQVHPEGTIDASAQFSGAASSDSEAIPAAPPPSLENAGAVRDFGHVAASDAAQDVAQATARDGSADGASGYQVTLTPRDLAVTIDAVPYKLDHLSGSVTIQPDLVELKDVIGHHGGAIVRVSGSGIGSGAATAWDLKLAGDHMLIDNDLRRATPPALTNLLRSLQMQGSVNFDFSKLSLAPAPAAPPATAASPATQSTIVAAALPALQTPQPAPPPPAAPVTDVQFAVRISSPDASMDVGVPLEHIRGIADLTGDTRGGSLHQMSGTIDAQSLTLAQRSLTDLHVEMLKPADNDLLQIKKVQGRIAGGQLAGQMEWAFPTAGPSRYALAIVLQDADVQGLTGEQSKDIHGRLSASLNVEGNVGDPKSRQGRGDVAVTGADMYHIPLVLGLLQVTNLALPITSPFNEATARYSIAGQRVTFEQIELRAKEMLMQGSGHLDFDTKRVKMTFTTDNTTWPKLPIISDLITSARHELLQIHITGTLQEPKVSAGTMNTFTTTVDQVFKGADDEPQLNVENRGRY